MSPKQTLTVVVQADAGSALRFLDARSAISAECERYGVTLRFLESETGALPPIGAQAGAFVPVVGYTEAFLTRALACLREQGLRGLVVGLDLPGSECSSICSDRGKSVRMLMAYFRRAGRTRTALFAVNRRALSDRQREETFLREGGRREDVYDNPGSLARCCDAFDFARHDSVICANDMAAVMLLARMREKGLDPAALYVAGFGNTYLSQFTRPALTSVGMDYAEAGRLAVRLCRFLQKQPAGVSVRLQTDVRLFVRASTGNLPFSGETPPPEASGEERGLRFVNDGDVLALDRINHTLSRCDEIDLSILAALDRGAKREEIAAELHIGLTTLRYRLNKLRDRLGVRGPAAVLALLKQYGMTFSAADEALTAAPETAPDEGGNRDRV